MEQHRRVFACLTTLLLFTHAMDTRAAFFQLAENSPAGLGNAFAGGAAIAEDASTVWYNPAGLTRLSGTELVAGAHAIFPSTQFSKSSATTRLGTPITGSDGGNAGETAMLPNIYLSHRVDDRMVIGLGINVPFGLATDYADNWVGRYHADRSEIETININPGIGYQVNDGLSLGVGVSYQKMSAMLSQWADLGTSCVLAQPPYGTTLPPGFCGAQGLASQQDDAKVSIEADDNAFGFNVGALWEPSKETRLGLAYRSPVKHHLTGAVDVTIYDAGQATLAALVNTVDGGANAYITLPATLSVSGFMKLNSQWALMGDITRTYWSKLPELRIYFDSGAANSVVTLNLNDVNRYSVGAVYRPGGAWAWRAGLALDQTPTPSAAYRTPRLPDENRRWLTLGTSYQSSERLVFDVAVAYIKVADADIDKSALDSENATRGNLNGQYSANIKILSAQLRWMID
ncbi:MAG: outer membrane protein transport protein [Sulfuricaulis sp.]|nr:outer membrane protein transport protein [Sulfuricaulis sp.]